MFFLPTCQVNLPFPATTRFLFHGRNTFAQGRDGGLHLLTSGTVRDFLRIIPGQGQWNGIYHISYIYILQYMIYGYNIWYILVYLEEIIEIIPYHLRSMIHYRSDPFFVLPCLASVCLSRSRCGFDSITSLKISVQRNHKVVRVEVGWNISLLN